MRTILMAATAFALAAPAFAQPPHDNARPNARSKELPDPRDEEIVRSIPDRREIEAMGDVAANAADAILSVPIGPIVEAANPGRRMSRREREETLGDRASRDDPYFRERMRDQIAVASIAVGVLADQMAAMAPVLRRTLEDAERRVRDAARGVPPPRDYDRDYGRDYDPDRDDGFRDDNSEDGPEAE